MLDMFLSFHAPNAGVLRVAIIVTGHWRNQTRTPFRVHGVTDPRRDGSAQRAQEGGYDTHASALNEREKSSPAQCRRRQSWFHHQAMR